MATGLFHCAVLPAQVTPAEGSDVSFTRDIRPLLVERCYACHGPDEDSRESGLALHQRQLAVAELDSGEIGIVPGEAESSEVFRRVSSTDADYRMPPEDEGEPLSAAEVQLIQRWIEQGAQYDLHWSYRPLVRPSVPDVDRLDWVKSPVDAFVLSGLGQAGLSPAQVASREKLIRRLSLDLIGLPPTPEDVESFLNDQRPDAYQRLVDRLLKSPAYGEHWARLWLDLARYADSQGYAQDELRTIWPYRDWVIRALNDDMPFDRFTIEQLAGDRLDEPTTDQLIATGFHRNTMTNTEGGTDDSEFRHAAVIDRINTTAQVWMGTTLGCAQCHSHKFDPISHEDYYRFFAVFNQTEDNDQPDNRPTIPVMTQAFQETAKSLQAEIAQLTAIDANDPAALAESDRRLAELKKQLAQLAMPRTPVMRELPSDKQRATHIAVGGAFSSPGQQVSPGVPRAFGAALEAPIDRLALAKWLVSRENPLTARVAVNRHWEQFFGTGIVETSEDFGSQGSLPSHPELLDWLAVELIERGWSLKQLCRTIVMSSAYQQSSRATPEKIASDPQNRLISRGPRHRLSAEQLRDYALAVSGQLSKKMFGPPVRPPQPKSGLNAAFGGSLDWEDSAGEDRCRRGIYTLWRRTNPYPSFMAMDATDRKTCTIRRISTNTPVAAFVTLNDPAFVEAAQQLARMMGNKPDRSVEDKIRWVFTRVVCRTPSQPEVDELNSLYESVNEKYSADAESARQMAGFTNQKNRQNKPAELAAWTVVCNVLLNLDEVLTKN